MDEFKLMDQVKEELCFVSASFQTDLTAVHLANQRPMGKTRKPPPPATDFRGELLRKGFVLPDFQTLMRGYVRTDNDAVPGVDGSGAGAGAGAGAGQHQELAMESERFAVPEVLFHPSDVGMDQGGVADACGEALAALSPVDAGLAAANLVLTGGNARLPQFEQRFFEEVRPLIPDSYASQAYLPPQPDYYPWMGARRFVEQGQQSGMLQKALITKKEYDDFGSQYTNERFWRGW